jgi:hypothetical protein
MLLNILDRVGQSQEGANHASWRCKLKDMVNVEVHVRESLGSPILLWPKAARQLRNGKYKTFVTA